MSYRMATATRPAHRRNVRTITGRKTARYAAALSLTAALIHLWAAPEHLREWWGYGTFFLTTALWQGLYGATLLYAPRSRSLILLGVFVNSAVVALYFVTRTVGVPFLGPHAGEAEEIGPVDLAATASELALIVALGAPWWRRNLRVLGWGIVALGLALVLVLFVHGTGHGHH